MTTILAVPCLSLVAQTPDRQGPAATIDCPLEGVPHLCSRAELVRSFAEAHVLTLASEPRDRVADAQMVRFAKDLSKTVASGDQPAQLALHLVRSPSAGVSVGPGDADLATLRVFAVKGAESHLVWVETYRGQPDMPWPAVVRALLKQLQGTLAGH